MSFRLSIFFLFIVLVLSVANKLEAAKTAPVAAAELAKVIVAPLQETPDLKRLIVPVRVEAKLSAMVVAETEGFVTKISKPLGSKVRKGEVVLYLENKDPGFTYAAVPVRAPVNGVVSQMYPTEMARMSRGDRLFTVMDPTKVKLTAEIPGSELAMVEQGAKAEFRNSLTEEKGLPVNVVAISPLVDPATSTASARFEFSGKNLQELPTIGTVGYVSLEKSRGNILTIPESALTYLEGKPLVKVLATDGSVQNRWIEIGEQRETALVVKKGLLQGEKIIVRSSRAVKEGEKVEVQDSAK